MHDYAGFDNRNYSQLIKLYVCSLVLSESTTGNGPLFPLRYSRYPLEKKSTNVGHIIKSKNFSIDRERRSTDALITAQGKQFILNL